MKVNANEERNLVKRTKIYRFVGASDSMSMKMCAHELLLLAAVRQVPTSLYFSLAIERISRTNSFSFTRYRSAESEMRRGYGGLFGIRVSFHLNDLQISIRPRFDSNAYLSGSPGPLQNTKPKSTGYLQVVFVTRSLYFRRQYCDWGVAGGVSEE